MQVTGTKLDWSIDPLAALARWPADRAVVMLHSGRLHERWSRWSILAQPVGRFRFNGDPQHGQSEWSGDPRLCPTRHWSHQPLGDLRQLINATANSGGLWIGYLSYDLARWIEQLPAQAAADRDWPLIDLAWCPGYLLHDAVESRWQACGSWRDALPLDLPRLPEQRGQVQAGEPRSVFASASAYESAIARVIEYIRAGDVFQVNLAQRFSTSLQGAPPLAHRAVYQRLAAISPAWYGAYLELDDPAAGVSRRRAIASTSPELFLEVTGRDVLTRPIKGTRPAGVDPRVLEQSAKDAAELNMIVDLLRNDLGRVCDYGSMRVVEARQIEAHPTVHHGVATIAGRLHPSRDLVDLLRATMPGGSITGAPKVRAMQIIEELEPVRRGPYCGAIGFLSAQQSCLNIAIRTLLLDSDPAGPGRVDFSVGGGIVADSDPAGERQETLDKAAALLAALKSG
jgi:para-aminobenzoate synthetase component 1